MAELCVGSLRDVEMVIEHWMRDRIGQESKMVTSSKTGERGERLARRKATTAGLIKLQEQMGIL